jgi:hypothetical protein
VSFIRPTISAKGAARAALAAFVFVAAGTVVVIKSGELYAGFVAASGEAALADAQSLKRGAERERLIATLQARVSDAVRYSPDNPRLWSIIAETRLMQATSTGLNNVSSVLVEAARKAAATSIKLAPNDSGAHARLAMVEALASDQAKGAAELARSYELDANSKTIGHRRVEVAGLVWRSLSDRAQRDVEGEVCSLAANSERDQAQIQNVRMTIADPGLALEIDRIFADPGCRPTPEVQTPAAQEG